MRICAEIVEAANSGIKKTHLMYRANLSFTQTKQYRVLLINLGLLEERIDGSLWATERGINYLVSYRKTESYLQKKEYSVPQITLDGNGKTTVTRPYS